MNATPSYINAALEQRSDERWQRHGVMLRGVDESRDERRFAPFRAALGAVGGIKVRRVARRAHAYVVDVDRRADDDATNRYAALSRAHDFRVRRGEHADSITFWHERHVPASIGALRRQLGIGGAAPSRALVLVVALVLAALALAATTWWQPADISAHVCRSAYCGLLPYGAHLVALVAK